MSGAAEIAAHSKQPHTISMEHQCVVHSRGFLTSICLLQMEKQVLEQTLQQVLEQPLTHSSPTTSQKSQKSDDDKNPNKEQVQLLA